MIEVIEKISSGILSNLTLYSVFSNAFNTEDPVILLKARANMVKSIEGILNQTEHDKEVVEIADDLCNIISHRNLSIPANQAGVRWSNAHLATVKMLFRAFEHSEGVKISLEISSIIDEIKGLEADEKQKEMLEEVFGAIETFHSQYAIMGERAFKELEIRLMGIFALYHEVFKSAPSQMRDGLNRVYGAVVKAKEVSDAMVSIGNSASTLLSMIGIK